MRGARRGDLQPLVQLRRLRLAVGLSVPELSRKTGASRRLIALLESGYRPRTVALVEIIASAIGVAPAALSAARLDIAVRDGLLAVAIPVVEPRPTTPEHSE